jgi:hypothetical protein
MAWNRAGWKNCASNVYVVFGHTLHHHAVTQTPIADICYAVFNSIVHQLITQRDL